MATNIIKILIEKLKNIRFRILSLFSSNESNYLLDITTPDKWVIIKIIHDDSNIVYKVFGSFYGGYTGSDSWKINSGIVKINEDKKYYYFYGQSGSCYKCYKKTYGTSSYVYGVITNMIDKALEHDVIIEIMDENNDWMKIM